MNMAHLHLMLNHLPVLGTVFGLCLLAVAAWKRSDELKKISLDVFVIVAVLAIPAYMTGEPAEELVRSLPGVSKALIEQHEETAQIALTGVLAVGVLALAGRIRFRRDQPIPAWLTATLLALALIVSGLMAWTANLGGQVRHPEIRTERPSTTAAIENAVDPKIVQLNLAGNR
ncbi:MAG: hypothetical protein ACYDH9_19985 [Limisphaerales bacterium]